MKNVVANLLRILFPPRETEKVVIAEGVTGLLKRYNPKHLNLHGNQMVGLLPYRDPIVRSFILEAKFRGNKQAQEALGTVLAHYLKEQPNITLIPVPLGKKRLKERKYNQTEEICRAAITHLSRETSILPHALVRTRDTKPQTKLSGKERRENVTGAFAGNLIPDSSRSYIVIDDVVTTGATLTSCIEILRKRGMEYISALALAY